MERSINSVDQLEILRLLASDPEKEWAADQLGQAAQIPTHRLARHLDDLEARGLLSVKHGQRHLYRYGPSDPNLEILLARLLKLYNERPATVMKAIHSGTRNPLHYLADLFQLRRKE